MSVIVYTKPDCPQCEATKRGLRGRGIAFSARDVSLSADHRAEAEALAAIHGRQMPIVVAGEQVWTGFRHDRIRKLEGQG